MQPLVAPTRLTWLPSCWQTWQQQQQQEQQEVEEEAESVFLHQSWSVQSLNQESTPLSSDQKQQVKLELKVEGGIALGSEKQPLCPLC